MESKHRRGPRAMGAPDWPAVRKPPRRQANIKTEASSKVWRRSLDVHFHGLVLKIVSCFIDETLPFRR